MYRLIHDPTEIVLILSAGTPMAKQVASWIIQVLEGMPEFACLLPDKSHSTTRTSLEAYDIHHSLKGPKASASISCLGVTSTMQGYRATLLIADDIESMKNSATPLMREQLIQRTRDFTSINRTGDIVYLGTPQTNESIYNGLPDRGYEIRIWSGRFPTDEEMANYNDCLAPFIQERITAELQVGGGMTCKRGQVTDPGMMSEEDSTAKEIDQGPAYYNLQYMLDTKLSDEHKYPLKLSDMIFFPLDLEEAPGKFIWGPSPSTAINKRHGLPTNVSLYGPANAMIGETYTYTSRLLALDPSGEGTKHQDECGYSVVFVSNGKFCVMAVGGILNASSPAGQEQLTDIMNKYRVNEVVCEKNFGGGMFTTMMQGLVAKNKIRATVQEVWSTGQKELRIIDSLSPAWISHRIIFNEGIVEEDYLSVQKYPAERRVHYMFLYQAANLSREKSALIHDDKLEAVAIAIKHLAVAMKVDEEQALYDSNSTKLSEFMVNPNNSHQGMMLSTHDTVEMYNTGGGMFNNAMSRFN